MEKKGDISKTRTPVSKFTHSNGITLNCSLHLLCLARRLFPTNYKPTFVASSTKTGYRYPLFHTKVRTFVGFASYRYSCVAVTAARETSRSLRHSPTATIWTRGMLRPNSRASRKWRKRLSPEPAQSCACIVSRGARGGSDDTLSTLLWM